MPPSRRWFSSPSTPWLATSWTPPSILSSQPTSSSATMPTKEPPFPALATWRMSFRAPLPQ
eukprot:2229634-Rhodomonas_salina.1